MANNPDNPPAPAPQPGADDPRTYTQEEMDASVQLALSQLHLEYDIRDAARDLGVQDTDIVVRLVNTGELTLDQNGNATNIKEVVQNAVAKIKATFAPERASSPPRGPGPLNPARPNSTPAALPPGYFTRSQLKDSKFYLEHEGELLAAYREGRIVED